SRLPASRREADESLTLHAARPSEPPVAYDESWDDVLLHRLRMASASGRRPADGPVADLARHDAEHGTRYVPTLRAWLLAQGDPSAAARLLDVHPNTVRYRLRKMAEHTRLELDDPRMRLALAIALEVYAEGEA
ncbi:helix-turn-helix domain-containing protein, partial [Nocardiopsis composta]